MILRRLLEVSDRRVTPTAIVNERGEVVVRNPSFCRLFQIPEDSSAELRLDDVFDLQQASASEDVLPLLQGAFRVGVAKAGRSGLLAAHISPVYFDQRTYDVIQFFQIPRRSAIIQALGVLGLRSPKLPTTLTSALVPFVAVKQIGSTLSGFAGAVGGLVVALGFGGHSADLAEVGAVLLVGIVGDWILGLLEAGKNGYIVRGAIAKGLIGKIITYSVLILLVHTVGYALEHFVFASFGVQPGSVSMLFVLAVMAGLFAKDAFSTLTHADVLLGTQLQQKLLGRFLRNIASSSADDLDGLDKLIAAYLEGRLQVDESGKDASDA